MSKAVMTAMFAAAAAASALTLAACQQPADNRLGDTVSSQYRSPGEDLPPKQENEGSGHQRFESVEGHDALLQSRDRLVSRARWGCPGMA